MLKRDIIRKIAGPTIFTATFTKKDGSDRVMNCRLDVKKHLHGGQNNTMHKDNLLTVYDMQSKGYRTINTDTLKSISVKGKVYSAKELFNYLEVKCQE